jgi:flagellar protein FliO/FliZ
MDSVSFFWSFLKMLFALAIVIAIMIGAMVVIKKYFYQAPAGGIGNAMIHILSTCYLGPKNSFILLEVLGQVLVVGISNHEMSVLATITDSEAMDKLKKLRFQQNSFSAPDPFSRYKSLLQRLPGMKKD